LNGVILERRTWPYLHHKILVLRRMSNAAKQSAETSSKQLLRSVTCAPTRRV